MTASSPRWWRTLDRQHWFVFTLASLAWLFDCLCQQAFNLSRGGAVDALLHDPARATEYGSYTTSFLLVGWATGGLIFGAVGDRFGRARVLSYTLLIYSAGTGLCAFSSSYGMFCACLLFTGLGIGGVFGLAVALIADSLPDAARASALGSLQGLSTWGNIAAGCLGMGLGTVAATGGIPFHLAFWQALFLVGAVPAFVCFFVLRRLPEPERWVHARAEGLKRGIKFGSYGKLLSDPRWSKHAWLGLTFCCAGIIGLWGLGNFNPTIVRSIVDAHFASSSLSAAEVASQKALWTSKGLILQNVGGFFGMMSLAWVAHTRGRKIALAIALLLSFLTTVLVFWGLRTFSEIYWMLPLMGFGQLSVFAVYAIYLPELFPTSLRSTGTSFCYNVGRFAAASAPFTLGRLTKHLGGNIESFRTAGLWVSLVLLLGLAVIPFLPETKDQPLPAE